MTVIGLIFSSNILPIPLNIKKTKDNNKKYKTNKEQIEKQERGEKEDAERGKDT